MPNRNLYVRMIMIVLSILLLLSILFLPMYNRGMMGGELFPTDQSIYFDEAMEMLFEESNPMRYYVVAFNVVAMVAGVMMLVGSVFGSKIVCIISSAGGAGGMIYYLSDFIDEYGIEIISDMDSTAICIGFWTTLLLFVLCFAGALTLRKNVNKNNCNNETGESII